MIEWIFSLPQKIALHLDALPPKRAMQTTVYWGDISLTALLIGFTAFYLDQIPMRIAAGIDQIHKSRPWMKSLLTVNGRDVTLLGNVQPKLVQQSDIANIGLVPGVRRVSNNLEEQSSPSVEIRIHRSGGRVDLQGKLSGTVFDRVISAVSSAYPDDGISDRIMIDDRLGRPLWLDGLEQGLGSLQPLTEFNLYGWTDALLIDGAASSALLAKKVQYALPAGLHPGIHIDYQVREPEPENFSALSLVSGWNGSALFGIVPDDTIERALSRGFSELVTETRSEHFTSGVSVNPALEPSIALARMASLIPALHQVHDLRLETSGTGFMLSGRVDSSRQLGMLSIAIEESGMGTILDNRIFIDPANRQPEISIFRDRHRAVITGRLPSHRARVDLLAAMQAALGVEQIDEFINIEPNIAYSGWLNRWPVLLPVMPESVFGLTVSADGVMVSGQISSARQEHDIERALGSIFPGLRQVNWLTVAPD
jgi:hypothetical protein